MSERLSGQCLCGAVKFTAVPQAMEMGLCHCSICRRWAGGASMMVQCGSSVEIENEAGLGRYKSSPHTERMFCKTCGSNLFVSIQDGAGMLVVAQAFEDPSRFKFVREIFIDDKPDNYSFANDTRKVTGAEFAEFVARMAPKSS